MLDLRYARPNMRLETTPSVLKSMIRPTNMRLAQGAIAVLLLVVIRSLGEYFRLQYLHGDALAIAQVTPYVGGALFAAIALAASLISYLAAFYRISVGIAGVTVLVLLAHTIAVVS